MYGGGESNLRCRSSTENSRPILHAFTRTIRSTSVRCKHVLRRIRNSWTPRYDNCNIFLPESMCEQENKNCYSWSQLSEQPLVVVACRSVFIVYAAASYNDIASIVHQDMSATSIVPKISRGATGKTLGFAWIKTPWISVPYWRNPLLYGQL